MIQVRNFFENDLYYSERGGNKISKLINGKLSSPEITSISKISLHPNPSSDYIQVIGVTDKEAYKIYDSSGIEIQNGNIFNNKFNIEKLSNGLYFLVFEKGNIIKFSKI